MTPERLSEIRAEATEERDHWDNPMLWETLEALNAEHDCVLRALIDVQALTMRAARAEALLRKAVQLFKDADEDFQPTCALGTMSIAIDVVHEALAAIIGAKGQPSRLLASATR